MTPQPAPLPDSPLDAAIILALIFLLAMIFLILAFVTIPDKNSVLFAALASGVVGSGIGSFIGYRWGSSAGSKTKDETIAAIATKAPTP